MKNAVFISVVMCMVCTLLSGCDLLNSQIVQSTPVFTFIGMVPDETEDGFVFWGVEPYESGTVKSTVYCNDSVLGVLMESVLRDVDEFGFSARPVWYPDLVLTVVTIDQVGMEYSEKTMGVGFIFVDTRKEYKKP